LAGAGFSLFAQVWFVLFQVFLVSSEVGKIQIRMPAAGERVDAIQSHASKSRNLPTFCWSSVIGLVQDAESQL
jgi:hypothetical protein